jgi:tetratricopeptide (TPR) repeat protein
VSMKRRQFLRGVGILVPVTAAFPPELANTIDLARRVQTGGSFAQVVDGLSTETRTLISAYAHAAEEVIEPEIDDLTGRISEFLDQDVRVRDRMELYFDLAQLYTIKSFLRQNAHGDLTEGRVAAGAVRTFAQEIGHRDLEAWSYLLQVDSDFARGHYADAVASARKAYDVASSDAMRAKAASRGLARAFARQGNATEADRAVRLAEQADDRTPDDDARGGVFSLDRADVPMYTGGALLWVGEHSRDRKLIAQARDQSQRGLEILAGRGEWPREQAETRLDVAAASALLGEPERALQLARTSFQQHSPNLWMQFGADNVQRALPSSFQHDYGELTRAWTRGELTSS